LTPAQIRHAYGLDQITGDGAGQTIAIIVPYDAPTIQADLKAFDKQFKLPDPPSFKKVAQDGSTNYPPRDPAGPGPGSWEVESSLDVEWAHVLAPKANILLVEAKTATIGDLIIGAVGYAKAQPGVVAVSMSFGTQTGDINGETTLDSVFTTPKGHSGVTFLAATGNSGAPGGWPAFSPNVVAVGGTTLTLDAMGNYLGEVGWSGSGGGVSALEAQPAYQKGVVTQSLTKRTIPDVSFDADPASGVPIYDSTDFGAATPWDTIGGTDLGAPCWAGIIADIDQLRATTGSPPLDGVTQTLPRIYQNPITDYHDILSGNNGVYNAQVGYDLVTGRGSPALPSFVTDTEGFLKIISSTPANGSTVVGTAPTDFSLTFSAAYRPGSVRANELKVNGIPADSFTLTSPTVVTFHYNTTPVTTQGIETMAVAAGLIRPLAADPPNLAFSASFRYDALLIGIDSTRPANGGLAIAPLTSLTAHFNEAFDPATIANSNLTLSQGSVSGFTIVDAQTVTYNLTGLTTPGTLQISMDAGAVTDSFGNPGVGYNGSLLLVNAPTAFPTPLLPVTPDGSLIYQGSTTGTITAGSVDAYSLKVAAGQTISVLVTPSNGLQAQVNLSGSTVTNVAASGASASPDHPAAIQPVGIATTDNYIIAVSGLDSTTGDYTIQVYLNAALASSIAVGSLNQTLTTSQNIDSSFTNLGTTAQRGAVVGTLMPGQFGPDGFGYTAISIAPQFVDISSTGKPILAGAGDAFVKLSSLSGFKFSFYGTTYTSVYVSSNGLITFGSGNPSFVNTNLATSPLQPAIAPFWGNLLIGGGFNSAVYWQVQGIGAAQRMIIQWNQCSFYAGNHTGRLTFEAILNADGSIIYNYNSLNSGDYGTGGAAVTVGTTDGIVGGNRLLITYDATTQLVAPGSSLEITTKPVATPGTNFTAYYAFTLFAGQTVSVAGAGQGGATISVGLLNPQGKSLAAGSPPGNGSTVDSAIDNFVATADGTYYATVTGASGSAYSLVVTAGADFGLETNGSFDTAQNITGTGGVLSKILPAGTQSDNWYSVNLAAGAQITLQAYVLGDSAGAEFNDSLTPQVELYDPSVALMAVSGIDPSTGLQTITSTAATDGTYLVHVFGVSATSGEYFLSLSTIPPLDSMTAVGSSFALAAAVGTSGAADMAGPPVPSVSSGSPANSTTATSGPAAVASSTSAQFASAASQRVTPGFAASPVTHAASSVVQNVHDLIFAQFGADGDWNGLRLPPIGSGKILPSVTLSR
jgi:hypothetical protein